MALTKISRGLLNTGISDSSDATAITIDSSENVLVGSGTSNGISGSTTGLQVAGAGFAGMISATRHDNNAYSSALMLGKSRNTTVGSNTIVQSGDEIGAIGFFADDGTNLDSQVAYIRALVDGTPGENDTPGRLTFSTTADGSAAATERMRIDSSGNVGIGTSSPSSYYSKELVVAASDNGGITLVNSDTSHTAYLMFADGTSGADAYRGQVGYDHNNNSMFFATDSTVSLMINSSGNVLVGTTTGGSKVVAEAVPSGTTYLAKWSGTGGTALYLEVGGSAVGSITCTASGTSYNTSSDYRLKENVITDWNATTLLKQLKPSKFNFKDNQSETITGFIAHEIQEILPYLVNGEKDGEDMQSMDYAKLTPLLTKAIQEQQELIEDLQTRIEELET